MSKLQELIQQYCPDGVEYKELSKILTIRNGKDYKMFQTGNIPVYGSGGIMTYIDTYAYNKPSVLIPRKGSIDKLYYVDTPFWNVDTIFYTEIDNTQILPRYLYYHFQSNYVKNRINQLKERGVRFRFDFDRWNNIEIPIPPLELQEEIVNNLDTFTNLISNLEKIITLRKKQYAYYLDELLTFGEDTPRAKLGEICKRQKGINITAFQMKELNKDNGVIRIFAGGNTIANVNYEDIPNANIINIPSIIVKSRGKVDFEYYDKPFTHKNELWSYSKNSDDIILKFIYYYLCNNLDYFIKKSVRGAMPQIATPDTDDFVIPLPPLDTQKRIVDILDNFEKYTNDLQEGLPAEIEKRKKQYAYYRDELLRFEFSTPTGTK